MKNKLSILLLSGLLIGCSDNETETLRFGPAPDTAYTGYLSYYKSFGALSDTNTTNYILNNHPGIYLYGSLYHAANFLRLKRFF